MREEILNITMTVDDEKVIGTTTDQVRGPRGYSAYEVAVLLGYVGNEESWLESLKVKGDRGSSAYRVAVDEGFVGTVSEWRDSLIGPRGPVYDDSDLREQIDLELASLTRIASEAADVATTKAGEAVDAKNVVVLRADEVDGHAVILYGLFDEIEDYRQEVYRRALESVEAAGVATTKASETVISAGEADQSAQAAAQSASEAEQTLLDKVSKSNIAQTTGQSSANIMSQKAVTDLFNNLVPWLGSEVPAEDAVFDFEKNRYAVKGVPVGMSDTSEFIRLSSATEWQNGQLVEVGENIPRISGEGLLIEPQRTNTGNAVSTLMTTPSSPMSDEIFISTYTNQSIGQSRKLALDKEGFLSTKVAGTGYAYLPSHPTIFVKSSCRYLRVLVSFLSHLSVTYDLQTGSIVHKGTSYHLDPIIEKHGEWFRVSMAVLDSGGYVNMIEASDTLNFRNSQHPQQAGDYIEVWADQRERAEEDLKPTSYIFNNDVPVTRSPDILNIPLLPSQTLTGDWDEGVSYEVADNIATFTGHGYIRNITVEEL